MDKSQIEDRVEPVPEEILEGKSEKERFDISKGYRAFTRLKAQESALATNAFLKSASSEEKILLPNRRVASQPGKGIVKVTIPKTILALRGGGGGKPSASTRTPLPVSATAKFPPSKNSSPSERIAVFYTPTANVRTQHRQDQMADHQYHTSYRNTQPLPPASEQTRLSDKGVVGVDPSCSHFIPLEEFDNTDFEMHSPRSWLANGPVSARSRYVTDKLEDVWAPCTVTDYDPLRNTFTIKWVHNGAIKNSKRLNILFDEEPEDQWKARVLEATRHRDEAEARVRLHLFVESMPDGIVQPPNEDQIDRILGLVASDFPLEHLHVIESNIAEVRHLHNLALKRSVHNYQFKSPLEVERLADLHLPALSVQSSEGLNDLLGTVDTPSPNFTSSRTVISENLFATHALLSHTINQVHGRWVHFQDGFFCDTILRGLPAPCELHSFIDAQEKAGMAVAERLRDDWSNNINITIQNDLDSHFNFYEEDIARFNESKMSRFFRMINLMMSSQLRQLTVDSIDEYARFLCTYRVRLPELFSAEDDLMEDLEADIQEFNRWHAIENELRESKRQEKEEASAQKTKNSKRKPKVEAEAEADDAAEDDASQLLMFPFEKSPIPFSRRIFEMTQVPNGLEPLLVIKLVGLTEEVQFSPLLEEVEASLKSVFDRFFYHSDGIRGIGDQLFPLLGLPPYILKSLGKDDPHVQSAQELINDVISGNLQGPLELRRMYKSFEYILKTDPDQLAERLISQKPPLGDFDLTLERLERDMKRIASRTMNEVKFELIRVECAPIKFELQLRARAISDAVLKVLSDRVLNDTRHVSRRYEDIFQRIGVEPKTPEELQSLKSYIDGVPEELGHLSALFQECTEASNLLHRYRAEASEERFESYWTAFEWPKKVHQQLDDSEFKCKEYRNYFITELRENIDMLGDHISTLTTDVENLVTVVNEQLADNHAVTVTEIQQRINSYEKDIALFSSHQQLFQTGDQLQFNIRDVKAQFQPYKDLWMTYAASSGSIEKWLADPVANTSIKEVEQQLQLWTHTVSGLLKKFKDPDPLRIAQNLRRKLDDFRPYGPLLSALKSNLYPSHWAKLKSILTTSGVPATDANKDGSKLSLSSYAAMGALQKMPEIQMIADTAKRCFELDADLGQMEGEWKKQQLEPDIQSKKLKSCDPIQQLLDDHIMRAQSLMSRPILRQKDSITIQLQVRVEVFYNELNNIQNILDSWFKCQGTWSYLEPIFISDDISKSMPAEAVKFRGVNESWIRIMESTVINPNVKSRCADETLLVTLNSHNNTLEEILRKLHIFLETKRMAFPRFYFISDDELLQILSDSKNPHLVQPYLAKCFEGISRLHFMDNNDIVAMESSEGEVVPLSKKVNPTDHANAVEVWLQAVESVMGESVREQLRKANDDYVTRKRTDFVRHWPGQVVLAVCTLYWTSQTAEAISSEGTPGLQAYHDQFAAQLDDLIVLIRDRGLKPVERLTLEALVVLEVHARDVLHEMAEKGVDSIDSFDWLAQLRYYWVDGHLDVCQINAKLRYGYEYIGNSSRLVITQLTDRCYRTLMGALHLNYGGAPEGPAGTGKTETTKDLAKALGKYCLVYNCSDQLSAKDMAKLFKGLSQAGAWGCFDEFNRIEIQVLSVIAQQIATIQEAIAQRRNEFLFEGAQIKLRAGSAVFITMNPGYAGRSELPDNLKALFRPVAMMVPNYAMIGQIKLFSFGFLDGKALAEKVVATYRLCSEQLSSQDHYDYGMRAVMAVLTAAGRLKRQYPDENESILMLRSIQDVNLPKFLSQDIELFRGIVSDLFPGVALPPADYDAMEKAMLESCTEFNLQPEPYFREKLFQTYEMILVRHGMMLVGYSYSGKTQVLHTLANSLTKMSANRLEEKTAITTINPKSITMDQLYGRLDPSGEWSDGVLSNIFRNMAVDTKPDRKWLVLDGPVDAVWVENMNSVLDDSKKLCLQNGNIIQMIKSMNMIFEVQDLAFASPATVSRCGMIYTEPDSLGWRCLLKSYRSVLPPVFSAHEHILLHFDALVEAFFPPMLDHIRRFAASAIPQGFNTSVASFIRLFSALVKTLDQSVDDEEVPDVPVFEGSELILLFESFFVFSLTWALGGPLYLKDRDTFTGVFFETAQSAASKGLRFAIPLDSKRSLFDGRFVMSAAREMSFAEWGEGDDFVIAPNAEYQSIIVPTADTAKYTFLMETLLSASLPALLVGDTGTGKTLMAKTLLHSMPKERYPSLLVQFSAQTSANAVQHMIDSKCERRRKGVYGPGLDKTLLIFIDDVNMPQMEKYGAQPPIELLRQWFDHNGWYSHTKDSIDFRRVESVLFLGAMGPPGGGRNPITQRFSRHFNTIAVPAFDQVTLRKIFECIALWILSKGFPQSVQVQYKNIVAATIDVYETLVNKLKPTPEKSHYTFNLRDVSKVFQGISMARAERIQDNERLFRLWAHESLRVFADRFIHQDDTDWFKGVLGETMSKHFKASFSNVLPTEPVVFAEFMNEYGYYEEITDLKEARSVLEDRLVNTGGAISEDFVVFSYVIEHVARISRILKQPSGHALLVGVGGSGRNSCTRLAAHCLDYKCDTIAVRKDYRRSDFLDEIREKLLSCGVDGISCAFMLSDSQIVDEVFLEDICNLLNSGTVPGIFDGKAERELLSNALNDLRVVVSQDDITMKEAGADVIQALFVERCRKHLHIVLCFSPVGSVLRERLRKFPSLVNCTTIDWFRVWPTDGLSGVATRFLSEMDLTDELRLSIRECFVAFHQDVRSLGIEYFAEARQQTYVTPTSYLGLLNSFKTMLKDKRSELKGLQLRYDGGLEQLRSTKKRVEDMQDELAVKLPQLDRQAKETDALIKEVTEQSNAAQIVQDRVQKEEAAATAIAEEARALKAVCDAQVDEATPVLEAAKKASRDLDNGQLAVIRSAVSSPVESVLNRVLEALCYLLNHKVHAEKDSMGKLLPINYFMQTKSTLLNNFKPRLLDFSLNMEEQATDEGVAKCQKKLEDPGLSDARVKTASEALLGLCAYMRGMVKYYHLNKQIKPLLAAASAAKAKEELAQTELAGKIEELRVITEAVDNMRAKLKASQEKKDALSNDVELTRLKIQRAQTLMAGLGGEGDRYVLESERYAVAYQNVVGDVVISSAIVAYLGPFQNKYRAKIISKWQGMVQERGIPHSSNFTLERFLGDPIQIQHWRLKQLPSDSFSVDNGIIIANALRYPLLVDPQQQANNWIRNWMSPLGLIVLRPSEKDYIRRLAIAVQEGKPVLLENVGEELDPVLENLLLRRISRDGGIVVGEEVVWNSGFRLFMTTKLPRPHYQPEVSTKVTLINFMITQGGLQDQLLQKVMLSERKEIEERKQLMTVEAASNKASLKETEDRILSLLSGSDNLLEDEAAILELDRSKTQSDRMEMRQKEIEATEKISDRTRQTFAEIAHVGASLFFCVTELSNIDPMYQYSLQFYISLFQAALSESEKADEVKERISNIISTFQFSLYTRICRSLFAKDQLLFSFIMTLKLLNVDLVEIRWLAMGGFERDAGLSANMCSSWLPDLNWRLIWRASSQLSSMSSLISHVVQHQSVVRQFYESTDPVGFEFPEPFSVFTDVQRLILFQCLRPDKMVPAVASYVESKLGSKFIESPLFNLEEIVGEMARDPSTAIIFVLSPGADPNAELDRVAEMRGMDKRLFKLSLGQGQDKPAKELISDAKRAGNWVLLQNCHLYKDFMPELTLIIEEYSREGSKENLNKDFRLWLTSSPSEFFPVAILQNGVKLVQEPPKGLKSNLTRSFTSDPIADPKFFNGSNKPEVFKKLLFGVAFFHSMVQERRKFGPLGWNRSYEFNDTDMRISVRQLLMFVNENAEVPYDAIAYLIGQCNYGGRVTDDWDRRCLVATLDVFLTPDILLDDYRFNVDCPEYFAPPAGDLEEYVEYVRSLPTYQRPGIFGLHANADITKDERDTRSLMDATLMTQPRESGSSSTQMDPRTQVYEYAQSIAAKLPQVFDLEKVALRYPHTYSQSMNTVLLQELTRYNTLLRVILPSLSNLQKAIKGEVVMSSDLENVLTAIYDNKIPEIWRKRSYPSLKPLGAYIDDLIKRLAFLEEWISNGPPSVFWISGFHFTQSFLTGVMQNYARKTGLEIDKLLWSFEVMPESHYDSPPADGCYINGLFLEGAGWNHETGLLCESRPKELYIPFPIIYLRPCRSTEVADVPHYKCPVYKTTDRQGVLSTTGHSTNFIMVANLPRRQNDPESHWVLRGTALFTQLQI